MPERLEGVKGSEIRSGVQGGQHHFPQNAMPRDDSLAEVCVPVAPDLPPPPPPGVPGACREGQQRQGPVSIRGKRF